MKTITLTLALAAALALSAALPAAAAGNNSNHEPVFTEEECIILGGVWKDDTADGHVECEYADGVKICDADGRNCEWFGDLDNRNVNRGPQAPTTAGVATAPESPQRGFQIQQAPTTAGVATAPVSPRRGFQIQPMFPAVGTFRIR